MRAPVLERWGWIDRHPVDRVSPFYRCLVNEPFHARQNLEHSAGFAGSNLPGGRW
jgi:hypothetical protein